MTDNEELPTPKDGGLLPCPFCGGAATRWESSGDVVCPECMADTPAEVWNRRAAQPAGRELLTAPVRYESVKALLRAYGMTAENAEKILDDEDFVSWLIPASPPPQATPDPQGNQERCTWPLGDCACYPGRVAAEAAQPTVVAGEDWESQIDIGSAAGPEPCLRAMVQHYYTSHGIPLKKAQSFTKKVLAVLSANPNPRSKTQPTVGAVSAEVEGLLKREKELSTELDGYAVKCPTHLAVRQRDLLRDCLVALQRLAPAAPSQPGRIKHDPECPHARLPFDCGCTEREPPDSDKERQK